MNNNKGMTLVELIVVLGMMGAVLLLAGTFLIFGNRNFARQREKTEALSSARYVMGYLSSEINKAENVQVNEGENTLTLDSSVIKLRGNTLYKDEGEIATGIDSITIIKDENKIVIEIEIKREKLSSTVYIR